VTLNYQPIPSVSGNGYTALTLREPGEWFDQPTWFVFVGGCGVAQTTTQADAERELLARAVSYCDRHIAYAKTQIEHYERQKRVLQSNGLIRQVD
jgi:hypothetical protein